jgi:F-type H+-transporting ATPase subunit b
VLVDWFTVAAQVVNFLILLALMRRFLYGPVLRAIRTREEAIAARMDESQRLATEAAVRGQELELQRRTFEQERGRRLEELREEVATARREQLAQVRDEVDRLQQRWEAAVARERDAFLAELRRRAAEQILAVVRRAVLDLSGEELDRVVIRRFTAELPRLDETQRELLRQVAAAEQPLVVRTASPADETTRAQIVAAVRREVAPGVQIEFDTSPDLLSGVELRVPGFKLAWSMEDYLATLEEELQAAFGEEPLEDAAL